MLLLFIPIEMYFDQDTLEAKLQQISLYFSMLSNICHKMYCNFFINNFIVLAWPSSEFHICVTETHLRGASHENLQYFQYFDEVNTPLFHKKKDGIANIF